MDDREIVEAIAAGDPAGLAEAYDQHAESLYSYCRWKLQDPATAAGAVQDTYVVAASRVRGLTDPHRLRPWLYAVARNECQLRLVETEVEPGPELEMPGPGEDPEQAELRGLVRTALDGLTPGQREAIELDLRHDLHGADLAAVLGLPRNQAQDLISQARDQLEDELGPLLVARTGRQACPFLDMALDGWDGRMTALTRNRVSRHMDDCDVCANRERAMLRPTVLFGMPPLAAIPAGLGDEVLGLCTDWSPQVLEYRQEVVDGAGAFRADGFPEPVAPPRKRVLALSGVAAAAGVVVALAATGIVTVFALTGSPAPHHTQAAASPSKTATAASTPTYIIAAPKLPTEEAPSTSAPPVTVPAVVATSARPATTKASPKPTVTTKSPSPSATATPTPSVSISLPTGTPTPTVTTTTPTPPVPSTTIVIANPNQ